jgi:hypothetical protein
VRSTVVVVTGPMVVLRVSVVVVVGSTSSLSTLMHPPKPVSIAVANTKGRLNFKMVFFILV